MLSLSDATKLESLGDKAVKRFRPWWDVLAFYCLNGLLMAVLFALAGITISGTYNIWCFPLGHDTALDYSVMNYVSSRCSRIFDGSYLIYFPYFMFLEWAVFFAVHLLWFKLPATFFLFEQLSDVYSEFGTIKPVEYNTEKRISKGYAGFSSRLTGLHLLENKETKQKVRNLVDRLMEIIKEDRHLVVMYTVKAAFLCVSNIVVLLVLIVSLYGRHWQASFPCDLSNYVPMIYDSLTCSLPAAPFLYGLMISNMIFAFFIGLCNLAALWWVLAFQMFTYSHYEEAFRKHTSLADKKGFKDFCFCLDLTSCTSKDGKILGDVIYSSLKLYQKSDRLPSYLDWMQESNKAKFSSMFYQGEVIAKKLGLKLCEYSVSHSSLFSAVAKISKGDIPVVRNAIAQELISNMSTYKDLVDDDVNCPYFEECVELIKDGKKIPKEFNNYILMAACNALRVNILLLKVNAKCRYYRLTNDTSSETVLTKCILFIPSNYYTPSEDDKEDNEDKKQLFISDPSFRMKLQEEAQKSWDNVGKGKHQQTVKALNPQIIAYGKTQVPPVKKPTNILTDVFSETGKVISKQIMNKIYIPGLKKHE